MEPIIKDAVVGHTPQDAGVRVFDRINMLLTDGANIQIRGKILWRFSNDCEKRNLRLLIRDPGGGGRAVR